MKPVMQYDADLAARNIINYCLQYTTEDYIKSLIYAAAYKNIQSLIKRLITMFPLSLTGFDDWLDEGLEISQRS